MDVFALSFAFLAGNVAVVNPCGFALLPGFLTYYVGADERSLPSASSRLAQGLLVGLMVTVAFLAVFSIVGIPVAYGAAFLGSAIPWVTIAVGAGLIAMGILQLVGRHIAIPIPMRMIAGRERRLGTFFLFGVAYAISSLGCTLPIFLSVVGSSLTSAGPLGALAVFAAYGVGMGTLIMALTIGAALLRTGLATGLRRLMPRFNRVSGGLLVAVGAYLIFYWGSALSDPAGFVENPVLQLGARLSSSAQTWLASDFGRWFVSGAVVLVLAAIAALLLRAPRIEKEGRAAPDPTRSAP